MGRGQGVVKGHYIVKQRNLGFPGHLVAIVDIPLTWLNVYPSSLGLSCIVRTLKCKLHGNTSWKMRKTIRFKRDGEV